LRSQYRHLGQTDVAHSHSRSRLFERVISLLFTRSSSLIVEYTGMAIVCQGETGQKLAVCQKDDVSIHDIVIDVAKQGKVIVPLIDQGETTTAKKLITDNNTLTGQTWFA